MKKQYVIVKNGKQKYLFCYRKKECGFYPFKNKKTFKKALKFFNLLKQ
jgi:hypothetical protein